MRKSASAFLVAQALVIAGVLLLVSLPLANSGGVTTTSASQSSVSSESSTSSASSHASTTGAPVNETIFIQVVNSTSGSPISGEPLTAGPASSAKDIAYTPGGPTIGECSHQVASGATVLANGDVVSNGTTTTYAACPLEAYVTNATGWATITNQNASYFFIEAGTRMVSNTEIIAVIGSQTYVTAPFPEGNFTVSGTASGTQTEAMDSAGLVLSLSDNAVNGSVPENTLLTFTVAIYNPAAQVLNLSGSLAEMRFPFIGFPIAPNPQCLWGAPLEFVVLQGNYNASSIAATLPKGAPTWIACSEGGRPVDWYAFQPQSQQAVLRGVFCSLCSSENDFVTDSGPYFSNATLFFSGYYNSSQLPQGGSMPFYGTPTEWTPGVYTLAVGDAWGGLAILHFSVTQAGSSNSLPPYVCDPTTAQCQEVVPGQPPQ